MHTERIATVEKTTKGLSASGAIDDRRRRCVVIVGNGLSLDLVNHHDLADRCHLKSLIPQPESVRLIPLKPDGDTEPPVWSEESFPTLFRRWHAIRLRSQSDQLATTQFLEEMNHESPVNPSAHKGLVSLDMKHDSYQLRTYLWNLARTWDHAFGEYISTLRGCQRVRDWSWAAIFRQITRSFHTTYVSFNYDCFLETALANAGIASSGPPSGCLQVYKHRKPGYVVILKPHGSYCFFGPPHFNCSLPEPWKAMTILGDLEFTKSVIRRYPVEKYPLLPDLIPPGHSTQHFSNPTSDVQETVREAIHDCDLILCAGFSANPPDHTEFKGYVDQLRGSVPALLVGKDLKGRPTRARAILRAKKRRYLELDVDQSDPWEVADLIDRLRVTR